MPLLDGRLTFHNEDGSFGVEGVDMTKLDDKLYSCICKLKDYEDIGFHPGSIEVLLKTRDEAILRADRLEEKYTGTSDGWFNAKDVFPEADEAVLVVVDGKYKNITFEDAVMTAEYIDDGDWWIEAYPRWSNPVVKFWRPLPEPPEAEGR